MWREPCDEERLTFRPQRFLLLCRQRGQNHVPVLVPWWCMALRPECCTVLHVVESTVVEGDVLCIADYLLLSKRALSVAGACVICYRAWWRRLQLSYVHRRLPPSVLS